MGMMLGWAPGQTLQARSSAAAGSANGGGLAVDTTVRLPLPSAAHEGR